MRGRLGFTQFELVVALALVAVTGVLGLVVSSALASRERMASARRSVSTLETATGPAIAESSSPPVRRRRRSGRIAAVTSATNASGAPSSPDADADDDMVAPPRVGPEPDEDAPSIDMIGPLLLDDDAADERPAPPHEAPVHETPADESPEHHDRP